MYGYKLVTLNGDTFYYDIDELEQAREDKRVLGGKLTDNNGKEY